MNAEMNATDIQDYYLDEMIGTSKNNILPVQSYDPTTTRIIDYFKTEKGGIEYDWSDFLWCKYFNRIPNNFLVTLRRFPHPCEDNIYNRMKYFIQGKKGDGDEFSKHEKHDLTEPDLSRAVTWMSETTGTKMEDLLSFTYGYAWEEQNANTTTQQSNDKGYTSHKFYEKMFASGQVLVDLIKGVSAGEKVRREYFSGHDPLKETYENFVIGPVNVVNKMQTRGQGLNFTQELKLTFEYKLKSYSGINPKVAMLDLLANLLVLTYSNANFWGGANRFYGADGFVASRIGDTSKMISGDYKGYLESVADELMGGFKGLFGDKDSGTFTMDSLLKGGGSFGKSLLTNIMNNKIFNMMGGLPAFQMTKGYLTGEPTGNWHLTIGNPLNPIAMIGNLVLKDSKISFGNGLGADDFPNELKLEVTLEHGRPRDKTDIESMFNAGKGRLYAAATENDVLNLMGKDVKVYGAFQGSEVTKNSASSVSSSGDSKKVEKTFDKWTGGENADYSKKTIGVVERLIHF
jgi:hypothetical protein